MNNRKVAVIALGSALLASGPACAFGDMGKSPVTNGTIVSGEGGFLLWSDDDIPGFGISKSGFNFKDDNVSPDEGWFAGAMIGIARPQPVIAGLWFTRLEGYALYGRAEDDTSKQATGPGSISLTSVDANALIAAINDRGRASASRQSIEGGVHFERDSIYDPTWSITWVINPFIRNVDEDAFGACNCARRTGDANTWLYGVMFDAEPEKWISQNVALVGRAGVGFYGFNADGDFNSRGIAFGAGPDPLKAHVSDSDSGIGFRGALGAGLKFKVGQTGMLETFAEADYFSDVGTVNLPSNTFSASAPANVGTDDLWELRAGARLTFAISGTGSN